jgi:hypothetical protein
LKTNPKGVQIAEEQRSSKGEAATGWEGNKKESMSLLFIFVLLMYYHILQE